MDYRREAEQTPHRSLVLGGTELHETKGDFLPVPMLGRQLTSSRGCYDKWLPFMRDGEIAMIVYLLSLLRRSVVGTIYGGRSNLILYRKSPKEGYLHHRKK